MTDERLAQLFDEGTAPERDVAFARSVDAEIGRARRRVRLALGLRGLALLSLAGAVFMAGRTIEPALARIAENWPQFMGVPVPLVLGALAVGLAVSALRFVRLRLS